MAKVLKFLGRTLGGIVEWTMILVILLAFLIRTSAVQTYLAQKTASYLSGELNAKVNIDKVDIYFFDRVALGGLRIHDQQGETLLKANRILVNLDNISIKKKSYTIAEAKIQKAFIHIQRDKDSVFNYAFIKDYFVKPKKKKSYVDFNLRYAKLSDTRFRYDDHLHEKKEKGMDYFHLDARDIAGEILNLKMDKDTITGDIQRFTAKEKCGFDLECLSTHAKVSPKGIYLSGLEIFTKDSWIKTKHFDMVSNNYTNFRQFVDSVTFDAQIDASDVALDEIVYFAPALEGMNDRVKVNSKIYGSVSTLRLPEFELYYGEKTYVKGKIKIADYRNFENGFFDERIHDFHIDFEELKKFRLPNSAPEPYISLTPELNRLEFIEGEKLALIGGRQDFTFFADKFNTALGNIELHYGVSFDLAPSEDHYIFSPPEGVPGNNMIVNNFNVGAYIANPDVGLIDGSLKLAGLAYSPSDIRFTSILGDINKFEYLNYPYSNISINEGTFFDKRFTGDITVNDEFLSLTYKGYLDFNGNNHMNFNVHIKDSDLEKLNLTEAQAQLLSNIDVDITGKTLDSYNGKVAFDCLSYAIEDPETGEVRNFEVDDFALEIIRGPKVDSFLVTGSAVEAKIVGKLNMMTIIDNFNYQFSKVFPALYSEKAKKFAEPNIDHFSYNVKFHSPNHIAHLFYPELDIAPGTSIKGDYKPKENKIELIVKSDSLRYKSMLFTDLNLRQNLEKDLATTYYTVSRFQYSDSLYFDSLIFKTNGTNNKLDHILTWKELALNKTSKISWDTHVKDADHYGFKLNPSFFYIQEHQWDISHASNVEFKQDTIRVDNFELSRNGQRIMVDGQVSNEIKDKLHFEVENLELAELSPFITSDYPMSGIINLNASISDPLNNFGYEGEGSLKKFFVKNQKVGDLNVSSHWDDIKRGIKTTGNLYYATEKTFDFDGYYYLFEEDDNLDFNLNFDLTNLQFTNAFMDPDVVSEIRGYLDGNLHLSGNTSLPILAGDIALRSGSAYIDLLGVHFGLDGPVEVDEYGFYINGIPVFDQDGNTGLLVGSVFHDNFSNFNFDLQFDLEPQLMASNEPIFGPESFQRFLVMDLPYTHDALYFGKGYVTGNANIFGYTDNLEITVDFKTQKGTELNIPMFGVGEIEEDDFIQFVSDSIDTMVTVEPPLFDLTGVYMDLNFEATTDADVKIIFNEDIGDVITANGTGDISIRLDNQNELNMEGTYKVSEGEYNFAMDPISKNAIAIKQLFIIEPGGTISWTGDPYSAQIDLQTYYRLSANLSEISGGSDLGSSGGGHQPVYPYLLITGTMESPVIQFDIRAPQAGDIGQSLLNRIKSDPDELNRQFFSLMLARQFQAIAGSNDRSGGGALEIVTSQINQALARVSKDYRLKLDIDNDIVSGDNTFEFGVSKGFLDDRLILSGSFGVESYGEDEVDDNGQVHTGQLIGDLNLEYLLNESGTFRVNIFNESNDHTVIQEGGQGDFTQGAGLSYQEDFESFEDFKVAQYVLDVFRKKENRRYLGKGKRRQQRPVPNGDAALPKEEE
ncbi:MAG: translocation/assembly module TamB [bacterium]|nr:translocation/assembly module TamB [bacterium]